MDILSVNDAYSEHNYALVSVYSFSRWPTVVPLRTKSAQEVAFALLNIFADRHVPHTIRNDKGHEFEAEVNELCDLFGIRRVLVDVGTSNSNGIVERLHREVNTIITRFVNGLRDEGSDWIQLIPAIHVHLRRQVNASTGFSPTELEHVRDPTYSSAMDTALTTEHHTFEDSVAIEDTFFEAVKLLRQRRQKALANDIATRDVRLRRQNKDRRPHSLEVGGYAFVKMNTGAKHGAKTRPVPYKIVEQLRSNSFRLWDPIAQKSIDVAAKNLLPAREPTADELKQAVAVKAVDGPPASLVVEQGSGRRLITVAYDPQDNPQDSGVRMYINARPSQKGRTAHVYNLSPVRVKPASVLKHFNFERSSKGHLILPLAVHRMLHRQ